MITFDELFADALDREALPATQERRAAVAEGTVRGALRRRRAVAMVQGVAVVAVIGIGAVVASLVLNRAPVPPATPAPTPPSPTPSVTASPSLDYASALDGRLPRAPVMSEGHWAEATTAWDAELAANIGGGRQTYGSTIAIYLTAPGGERELAWATDDTTLVQPVLLSVDVAARTALVFDYGTGHVSRVDLRTAAVTEVDLGLSGRVGDAHPLGRARNGDPLFAVTELNSDGEGHGVIMRDTGDGLVTVHRGYTSLGEMWGDLIAVTQNGVPVTVKADGSGAREFADMGGCSFQVWNTDGTFTVNCPTTQDRTGDYYAIDPADGAATLLAKDAALDEPTTDTSALTEFHAIDAERSWSGIGTALTNTWPPTVFWNGVEVANLADGFVNSPTAYSVIFGVQGEG